MLESMRNPGPIDLYNMACGYAQLSFLLAKASTSEASGEREALADRAMELLRLSLAAGMTDFALIDHDHIWTRSAPAQTSRALPRSRLSVQSFRPRPLIGTRRPAALSVSGSLRSESRTSTIFGPHPAPFSDDIVG